MSRVRAEADALRLQSHGLPRVQAIPLLRQAIAVAEADGDVALRAQTRVWLGHHLASSGDLVAAEDLLATALALDAAVETTYGFCLCRGRLHMGRHALDEAERQFRLALVHAEDPLNKAAACVFLGAALRRGGRLPEALASCRRALELLEPVEGAGQVQGRAHNQIGEICRAMGRLEEAEEAYRRFLEVIPDTASPTLARLNLVMVQLRRGRHDEARAELEVLLAGPVAGRVTHFGVRLALTLCAANSGDDALWRASFPGWASGRMPVDTDLAWLARQAGRAAPPHGPWPARAARAHRIALHQFTALQRPGDVQVEEDALRALARGGAATPLGSFGLERTLGEGSFGQVWRATHPDGTQVAVKVLAGDFPARAAEQLSNELRAVAALDHPHIVRLLHHGTIGRAAAVMRPGLTEGSPWIATDFAGGGTLQEQLGGLAFAEVHRIVQGLLSALAHAHARGLLHLDVKPANVLLSDTSETRTALLADFGLATALSATRRRISGSPHYMAPEQFRPGMRDIGPWTDLYAVGCLTLALVCGVPPWHGTIAQIRAGHQAGDFAFDPIVEVPAALEPWIRRLMTKDPAQRFRRASDAARVWSSLESARWEDGLCVLPEPMVPVQWQSTRRPRPAPVLEAGLGLFGLRRTEIVGRVRQRGLLWAALRQVHAQGSAQAVILEGAPGHGANVLARWLCERAHETGAATPIEVDELGDALARHTRVAGAMDAGARQRRLRAALPGATPGELALLTATLGGPDGLHAVHRRRLLLRGVFRMARDRPVVLRLLAPHDPRLIRDALELDAPILVVATPHPTTVESIVDDPRVVTVPVPALDDDQIHDLVRGRLPLRDALRRKVVAASAGSPRLAEQFLTHLVSTDRLVTDDAGWRLRRGTDGDLPVSSEALWRERLAQALRGASAAERDALQVAAVLGLVVDRGVWERACVAAHAGSAMGSDRLLDAGLATPRASGWAFVDEEVVGTILDGVGAAALHRLHRACAEALDGGDPDRQAAHWEAAGDTGHAIDALLRAQRIAVEHGEWVEADRLIHRCGALLDAASDPTPRWAAQLAVDRGSVAHARGDGATARAHFWAAVELDTEADPTVGVFGLVGLTVVGAGPDRFDEWTRRVELASRSEVPQVRARALLLTGRALRDDGDLTGGRDHLQRALAAAGSEASDLRARVRSALGDLALREGDLDLARSELTEAMADYEAAQRPMRAHFVALGIGDLLRREGHLEAAAASYVSAFEALDAVGSPRAVAAAANIVLVRWAQGRRADGDALAWTLWRRPRPVEPAATMAALVTLPPAAVGDPTDFADVWSAVCGGLQPVLSGPDARWCIRSAIVRARAGGFTDRAAAMEAWLDGRPSLRS